MRRAASDAALGLDSAASTMTGRCRTSSPLFQVSKRSVAVLRNERKVIPDCLVHQTRRIISLTMLV